MRILQQHNYSNLESFKNFLNSKCNCNYHIVISDQNCRQFSQDINEIISYMDTVPYNCNSITLLGDTFEVSDIRRLNLMTNALNLSFIVFRSFNRDILKFSLLFDKNIQKIYDFSLGIDNYYSCIDSNNLIKLNNIPSNIVVIYINELDNLYAKLLANKLQKLDTTKLILIFQDVNQFEVIQNLVYNIWENEHK